MLDRGLDLVEDRRIIVHRSFPDGHQP
jgi:hypothetical protein